MQDDLRLIEDAATFFSLQELLLELDEASGTTVLRKPRAKTTHFFLGVIRKIPVLTGFGNNAAGAGFAVLDIEKQFKHLTESLKVWSHHLQITALVLAAIDFIRVPGIYFFSWLFNERVPISTPKNARWLHTSVLLAFAALALIAPSTAGLTGLVGAVIGFCVGALNLGRYFYRKAQIAQDLIATKSIFQAEIQTFLHLKKKAQKIRQDLQSAISGSDTQLVKDHYQQGIVCVENISRQQARLQDLYSRQCHFERKIQKRGPATLADKCVGLLLGASGLIGTVLAMHMALSGLFILAASAVFGCIYSASRTIYPLISEKSEQSCQMDDSTKTIMKKLHAFDKDLVLSSTPHLSENAPTLSARNINDSSAQINALSQDNTPSACVRL